MPAKATSLALQWLQLHPSFGYRRTQEYGREPRPESQGSCAVFFLRCLLHELACVSSLPPPIQVLIGSLQKLRGCLPNRWCEAPLDLHPAVRIGGGLLVNHDATLRRLRYLRQPLPLHFHLRCFYQGDKGYELLGRWLLPIPPLPPSSPQTRRRFIKSRRGGVRLNKSTQTATELINI